MEQLRSAPWDSEARLRLVASVTSAFIFSSRFNAQGALEETLLTGAVEAITGYSPNEFLSAADWWVALLHDHWPLGTQHGGAEPEPVVTEMPLLRKDGSLCWVRASTYPIWAAESTQLAAIDGAVQDITERKRTEARERAIALSLRAVVEAADELIAIQNLDTFYRRAVELAREKLKVERCALFLFDAPYAHLMGTYGTDEHGHTTDERGAPIEISRQEFELLNRDNSPWIVLEAKQTMWDGEQIRAVGFGWIANTIIRAGDEVVGMFSNDSLLTHAPLDPIQQEAIFLYCSFVGNILKNKRAEESLRLSELRYRIISELISDYAYAYDVYPDGSFKSAWITDHSFTRLTGFTWSEIGTTFNLYHPDDIERSRQDVALTIQGQPQHGEYRIITKSGELKWVHIDRLAEWDAEHKHVVRFYGAAQDITARKQLEGEVERNTKQLEQIVLERTAQLRRAKEEIEAILNNVNDGIALAHPSGSIESTNPAFRVLFGEDVAAASDVLRSFSDNQQREALVDAIADVVVTQQPRRVDARIMNARGVEIDLDIAIVAFADDDKTSVLLSVHDITHLKELERFKERFMANAVHDLGSPLTALSTHLYLLRRSPEPLADHATILEHQVGRLKELVLDLRSLSEIDRGGVALALEPLNLNDLVAQVIETYQPLCAEKRQLLSFVPYPNLPAALLDRRKCDRVLVNLVANAINYSPEGAEIRVLTGVADHAIRFVVEDQGIGIPAGDIPHIFERFYRTDEAKRTHDSGTGLGLAIVKEMVEAHHGTIRVDSILGQGSRFTVHFPALDGAEG